MPRADREDQAYNLIVRLDRLESLLEDMDELGVSSRDELVAKIQELHRQVDDLEQR